MDRIAAYSEVCRQLECFRSRGYAALRVLVNEPPQKSVLQIAGEDNSIEIQVHAISKPEGALRIEASAFGANWFRNERIDEEIIVLPPEEAEK